jgi:hypothetical protein
MLHTDREARRFTRVSAGSEVEFYDGSGVRGSASLKDVSYGGLRITAGRYIKPRTPIQVPVSVGEEKLSFPAQVVWCSPDPESQRFQIGLRADHGGKHTMAILSSWVLEAVQTANGACACGAPA